ncbi:MAG: hypothetical protein KDC28_09710 [Saprospiraceae bacterium]|mgnify:CR=1 FL=1|nr:hypothetical protein [Saprospiraceae bacterium]MCB9320836.1 hypothetical protein [Lewinellaceae bacterium]
MTRFLLHFLLLSVLVSCSDKDAASGNLAPLPVDLPAMLHSIYQQNQFHPVSKTLQYAGEATETKPIDSTEFHQDLKFLESFALNDRSFADQFRQTRDNPLTYEAISKKPYVRSIMIWPGETSTPDSIHISYAMHQITGTRNMELTLIPAYGFRLEIHEDNRMQKNLNFTVREVWQYE